MAEDAISPDKLGTGRLDGYRKWHGFDPYEEHTGPFYFREIAPGRFRCAFVAGPHHVNGGGAIHGGCLMTFADYALFALAGSALEGISGVTVSFSSEFIGAGLEGDFVFAEGEVVRETGSMLFLRGLVSADRDGADTPIPLLNFSGIIKKIRPRT